MIVKRIRKGPRQARGSIARVIASVQALSRYVVDADPWAMAALDRVRSLTDYALHVQERGIEPGEKVAAAGTFNLHGGDLHSWQMEMAAIAARAPRSRDPLEHFVYSWRENESPTAAQVEEAGAILLEVLGYGACPAIWSFHGNTDKDHGHLAVVRIDPATGLVAGDGWDIDRAHQAIALIEERQGWSSEPNALYVARDGEVYDRLTDVKVRDREGRQFGRRGVKPLPAKLADKAIEIRQAVIGATDWADLHARMAAIGAVYRRKGSGAVIAVRDEEVKASLVHAGCGLVQLQDKLGPFEPDPSHVEQGYEAYRDAYRQRLDHIRAAHAQERARLKAWLDQVLASLGSGADPAIAAAVRSEYASTLGALDAAFAGAKAEFAAARLSAHRWETGPRPAIPSGFSLPMLLLPATSSVEQAVEAPAQYHPRPDGWKTHYVDDHGTQVFTDLRSAIIIHKPTADSIDAALTLAAARWGRVRVRASRADTVAIAERAAVLGVIVVNPDGRRLTVPVRPASVTSLPPVMPSLPRVVPVPAAPVAEHAPTPPSAPPIGVDDDIPLAVRLAWAAGAGRSL